MPIYADYAQVYDRSGQLKFSLDMLPYLARLLERHPAPGRTMLDLACGTGTVAMAMAREGWQVHGIDGSEQMLAQARAKEAEGADPSATPVTWSRQDMRSFSLPGRVDLATCLYDSMNYMLSDADLLAVMRGIYRTLAPGGLFLFDMNTAWALSTFWDGQTYFTDAEHLSMIMESQYDDTRQRTTVQVTCFERLGEENLYRKIVETHTEQAYPPEQIATLLTDVGLHIEASYSCFSFRAPSPTTARIMWAARRP